MVENINLGIRLPEFKLQLCYLKPWSTCTSYLTSLSQFPHWQNEDKNITYRVILSLLCTKHLEQGQVHIKNHLSVLHYYYYISIFIVLKFKVLSIAHKDLQDEVLLLISPAPCNTHFPYIYLDSYCPQIPPGCLIPPYSAHFAAAPQTVCRVNFDSTWKTHLQSHLL